MDLPFDIDCIKNDQKWIYHLILIVLKNDQKWIYHLKLIVLKNNHKMDFLLNVEHRLKHSWWMIYYSTLVRLKNGLTIWHRLDWKNGFTIHIGWIEKWIYYSTLVRLKNGFAIWHRLDRSKNVRFPRRHWLHWKDSCCVIDKTNQDSHRSYDSTQ